MENIIALLGGLVLGGLGGYASVRAVFRKQISEANSKSDITLKEAELTAKRKIDEAEIQAEKIVSKAQQTNENIKQQKIQEAKEKFNQFKSEFESYKAEQKVAMKDREIQVVSAEKDLKIKLDEIASKTDQLEQRESEVKAIRENLDVQLKVVAKKKDELDQSIETKIKELENIAKLSQIEAKEQLLETIRAKAQSEAMSIERDAVANAKANASKEAKKIVIQTIQRMAAEYTIENTVSVFTIDSDDIKGQIIGREGRNIRALEAATGAEIVVDDTPESIVISSFDPIKREVCRLALKRLVADGRIHPAKIEEVVAKVKKQLDGQIGRAHV